MTNITHTLRWSSALDKSFSSCLCLPFDVSKCVLFSLFFLLLAVITQLSTVIGQERIIVETW